MYLSSQLVRTFPLEVLVLEELRRQCVLHEASELTHSWQFLQDFCHWMLPFCTYNELFYGSILFIKSWHNPIILVEVSFLPWIKQGGKAVEGTFFYMRKSHFSIWVEVSKMEKVFFNWKTIIKIWDRLPIEIINSEQKIPLKHTSSN